jgi:hypothetical protein
MNSIELKNEKLYVGLGSSINMSTWHSSSRNVQMEELNKPEGLVYFEVNSLKDASDLVKKFINDFRLGSSNWIGGVVLDSSMNFVAKISYNGRVWDNEDWRNAKEIKVC